MLCRDELYFEEYIELGISKSPSSDGLLCAKKTFRDFSKGFLSVVRTSKNHTSRVGLNDAGHGDVNGFIHVIAAVFDDDHGAVV